MKPLLDHFASRGWSPFDHQIRAWQAYLNGKSGLVHAPTGAGKTLSVFGGPLLEALSESGRSSYQTPNDNSTHVDISTHVDNSTHVGPVAPTPFAKRTVSKHASLRASTDPLRLIWVTPMRALANDTAHHLSNTSAELALNWSVELRTSDTSPAKRQKQKEKLPTILVTTPESLSVLLSYGSSPERLASVRSVVVDEWHELLSTKRGIQTELGLARLRTLNPDLRVWGLTATLGNLDQALEVLCPGMRDNAEMIHASIHKDLRVDTLLPESVDRFPWGGHMGLRMLDAVIRRIESGERTLVFLNTRAQAEIWFRSILDQRPEWLGQIAIHHGSLDRNLRLRVEGLLRERSTTQSNDPPQGDGWRNGLRAVICTSSLDLGVDFPAVDQVIQIGSPKGIGRLMQRAGRSGHSPGEISRVWCVPTHAFELIEFSAAREGIEKQDVEPRKPIEKPLDVLVQHLVTISAGGGFQEQDMLRELRGTYAYRDLSDKDWRWCMDFIQHGGNTLRAYSRFAKVKSIDGRWHIADEKIARLHRLGIGTITSDGVVKLVLNNGKNLGTIEESFISRLEPGQAFIFGGRALELIGMRDMTARVRPATKKRGAVPQWAGGRFPLSTMLSEKVRARIDPSGDAAFNDPEMHAIKPVLKLQAEWSRRPGRHELLVETLRSREGTHHFLFTFLGRLVHEGLGALVAYRMKRRIDLPITATFTDYGIELLLPHAAGELLEHRLNESDWRQLLSDDMLLDDLLACLNSGELTRRQFREVSRVAGLLVPTSPGSPRSVRQLQASSELFYDVFVEFDPGNLLLEQARREVLDRQLDVGRLRSALAGLRNQRIICTFPESFTPLAFPIWAQRIQSQTITMEAAGERIERVLRQLESAAQAVKRT